jgi:hypothetical protein
VIIRELADLATAGPPPFDSVAALATSHGLEFGDAPWLPGLIARYWLKPPPTPDHEVFCTEGNRLVGRWIPPSGTDDGRLGAPTHRSRWFALAAGQASARYGRKL